MPAIVLPAMAISTVSGACQSPPGRTARPPRTISVVPGGIGCAAVTGAARRSLCRACVSRSSFERKTFLERRQESIVVDFCHVRDACQAECLPDLLDVLGEALAIIGADAVLARRRRDDLMAAKPGQAVALDVELGEVVVLPE